MDAPTLREENARAHFDAATWSRAEGYLEGAKLYALRRDAHTLKARVEGSAPTPYATTVTLSPDGGVSSARCSCAVGADGRCKHAAALARTWALRPEDFLALEPLDRALRRRSRDELEALIAEMLKREPALDSLLESPLPGQHNAPSPALPVYGRQAEEVFREHGAGYAAVVPIAEGLGPLLEVGDGFVATGDVERAAQTFDEVAQAVLDREEVYGPHDHRGLLREVVRGCVRGLGRALAIEDAPRDARRRCLRALVDILDADREGSASDEIPDLLLEHTLPDERVVLASWLRALGGDDELPASEESETPWDKIRHGQLLFDLVVDELPEESFARACRLLHRDAQLCEHWLLFGRVDDALSVARSAGVAELPAVADALRRHGHVADAARLVDARAAETGDAECLAWLLHHSPERRDPASVRRWTEALLCAEPEFERFLALRAMTPEAQWPEVRARVLAAPAVRAMTPVVARMLLAESMTDEALALVHDERTVATHRREALSGARLLVAEAAAESRPEAAVAIWQKHVDDLIATGQRPRYREAAVYTQKILRVMPPAEGIAWLKSLRQKNIRRRAVREELDRAGLGSAAQ